MRTTQLSTKVDNIGNTPTNTILVETGIFNEWDMNSLINLVIKQYHTDARKNIIIIYDLAHLVFGKHCKNHPELSKLVEELFLFFDDLLFHLKQEEQILFPNILQLNERKKYPGSIDYSTFGMIKELSLQMQHEHWSITKHLNIFRQLTRNYSIPADACTSYIDLLETMKQFEKDLLVHINLENTILFPKAIRMDEELQQPISKIKNT